MQVVWFAGRYDAYILGILPVGDVTEVIPPGQTELVVLDEPEHLTWHHHGSRWTQRFPHVVRDWTPGLRCTTAGMRTWDHGVQIMYWGARKQDTSIEPGSALMS